MALIGAVTWTRAAIVFVAQILGSIAASAVVLGLFPGPLNVATTLSPSTSIAQGLCTSSSISRVVMRANNA